MPRAVVRSAEGETASEIDHLLCSVQDTKQVESAECWMYHRSGIMRRENGARILNTSSLCVMQPSAPLFKEEEGWDSPNVKQAFPFIHGLLTHLLGRTYPGAGGRRPKPDRPVSVVAVSLLQMRP